MSDSQLAHYECETSKVFKIFDVFYQLSTLASIIRRGGKFAGFKKACGLTQHIRIIHDKCMRARHDEVIGHALNFRPFGGDLAVVRARNDEP